MSRESLRRFVEYGIKDPSICSIEDGGDEDVNLGEYKIGGTIIQKKHKRRSNLDSIRSMK